MKSSFAYEIGNLEVVTKMYGSLPVKTDIKYSSELSLDSKISSCSIILGSEGKVRKVAADLFPKIEHWSDNVEAFGKTGIEIHIGDYDGVVVCEFYFSPFEGDMDDLMEVVDRLETLKLIFVSKQTKYAFPVSRCNLYQDVIISNVYSLMLDEDKKVFSSLINVE